MGEGFFRDFCGESLNFLHLHSSCAIQPSFSPNLWGVQLLFQWSSGILDYYLYWIICLISLIIYPYFRSNVLCPIREDFEIWSSNPIHRLSAHQRPMLSRGIKWGTDRPQFQQVSLLTNINDENTDLMSKSIRAKSEVRGERKFDRRMCRSAKICTGPLAILGTHILASWVGRYRVSRIQGMKNQGQGRTWKLT